MLLVGTAPPAAERPSDFLRLACPTATATSASRLARVPVGQERKQKTKVAGNGALRRALPAIPPPADPAKTAHYDAIATGRRVRTLTAPGESVVEPGRCLQGRRCGGARRESH